MLNTSTTTYSAVSSISQFSTLTSPSYLKPNSFRFVIAKLPNVTYTCQSANLPALQLGSAMQTSPFVDIPHPGDKINFGEFTIRFLINEDMSNYKELYDWVINLGVPNRGEQWGRFNRGTVFDPNNYSGAMSDASLIVLDSNNNPTVRLNFQDLFPVSVEGLDFDITTAGMEYFVGIASFRYKLFTIQQY